MGVLDALLVRAQQTGAVRGDVGAVDVLMLVKGVCQAAATSSTSIPGSWSASSTSCGRP